MRQERMFPCCDNCGRVYAVILSESDAKCYDEKVETDSDDFPVFTSFENWISENPEFDNLWHACSYCGSDS